MVNGLSSTHCEVDDLYLIPTAEVPVTNIYRDVIQNIISCGAAFIYYETGMLFANLGAAYTVAF